MQQATSSWAQLCKNTGAWVCFVSRSPPESWNVRLSVRVQACGFPPIFKEECHQNKNLPTPQTDLTCEILASFTC